MGIVHRILNIDVIKKILSLENEYYTKYETFIETGTLVGDSIMNVYPYFIKLYTVELSDNLFNIFNDIKNERNLDRIDNRHGDSSDVLPDILDSLHKSDQCIFFLDGHWSNDNTARGEKDVPLIEECNAINNLYKAESGVVIVDDYRLFSLKGNEDWSEITEDSIKNCFTNFNIKTHVIDDMFVLFLEVK